MWLSGSTNQIRALKLCKPRTKSEVYTFNIYLTFNILLFPVFFCFLSNFNILFLFFYCCLLILDVLIDHVIVWVNQSNQGIVAMQITAKIELFPVFFNLFYSIMFLCLLCFCCLLIVGVFIDHVIVWINQSNKIIADHLQPCRSKAKYEFYTFNIYPTCNILVLFPVFFCFSFILFSFVCIVFVAFCFRCFHA